MKLHELADMILAAKENSPNTHKQDRDLDIVFWCKDTGSYIKINSCKLEPDQLMFDVSVSEEL